MPQIPEYFRQQAYRPGAIEGVPAAAPARAVGGLVDQLAQLGEKWQEAQRVSDLADANLAGLRALSDLELKLQQDPDWRSMPQRFEDGAAEIRDRIAAGLGDATVRTMFERDFEERVITRRVQVRTAALGRETDAARASLDANLDTYSGLAAAARSDVERAEILGLARGEIFGKAQAGFITLEDAGKRERQFLARVDEADVLRGLTFDPDGTLQSLLDPGLYPNLDEVARSRLIDRAQARADALARERIAAQEAAERAAERAERERAEEIAKEGDRLAAGGQLTAEWIEANRGALDGSDYRYFYGKLRGADAKTDPFVYSDLRTRAAAGEDVRGAARAELQSGRLTESSYDKIVAEVEGAGIAGELPSWYKRGLDYIGDALRVSDVNPDPAAAQRKANAIDDWRDWAANHKDATPADAQKEYRRIVAESAIIDFNEMTLTLRQPSYLVGSRAEPDLDATEAETVAAFEAGEIDRAEFERQAALIERWRQAIDRMKAQQP